MEEEDRLRLSIQNLENVGISAFRASDFSANALSSGYPRRKILVSCAQTTIIASIHHDAAWSEARRTSEQAGLLLRHYDAARQPAILADPASPARSTLIFITVTCLAANLITALNRSHTSMKSFTFRRPKNYALHSLQSRSCGNQHMAKTTRCRVRPEAHNPTRAVPHLDSDGQGATRMEV